MEKIIYTEEPMVKPAWLDDLGGYNTMPKPYREISWHEFFHRWLYSIGYLEHRQVFLEKNKPVLSLQIMWFWDEALAIASPGNWHCGKDEFGVDTIIWDDKPRFFKIGCEHDWQEEGAQYMCLHHYKCSKCGIGNTVDSSG